MNFGNFKKGAAAALAVCIMMSSSIFVSAADNAKITFEDITANDTGVLKGEAKVKVSVEGAAGTSTIMQTALNFTGDMKYKSIQFLTGENNPPQCVQISPNVAQANASGSILPGIATGKNGITLPENAALFILTFEGEPGDSVTLSCDNLEDTYFIVDGEELKAAESAAITLNASETENKGVDARIKLTMDKVTDFTASSGNDSYQPSGIELRITNEKTGYTVYTILSNASVNDGGNRDNSVTIPTFIFDNSLTEGSYTVELFGLGYVPYTKSGVTFNNALELTNADFIPGDVNCDGKVDKDDKAAYEALLADNEYSEAADFNRDGKVDAYDNVFKNITDGTDEKDDEKDDNKETGGSTGGSAGGSTGGSSGGSTGGSSGSNKGGSTTGGGFGGITPPPATTQNPQETFTDLENHTWAKTAIYALKNKGIISGITETEYAPAANIKRGDFMLILSRMLKLENEFTENFADVPESAYYYEAIARAKAAGIASGDGANFMPEATITRQDLITLAYRAFLNAGYIAETTDYSVLDSFADKAQISEYATAPLASMAAAGIITGDGTNVNPKGFATRAEVAVMGERLLSLIK